MLVRIGRIPGEAHRPSVRDRLNHALHEPALADRPAAVGAAVMPGKKFAIEVEDTDSDSPHWTTLRSPSA